MPARQLIIGDKQDGDVLLISTGDGSTFGNSLSGGPVFAPDGLTLGFESFASNLVSPDRNQGSDLFLADLASGDLERLSSAGNGLPRGASMVDLAFAPDGRSVAYIADFSSTERGIFVEDRATGTVRQVVATTGDPLVDFGIRFGFQTLAFTPEGDGLLFESRLALVADDTNDAKDIYRVGLDAGEVTRLSTDASGAQWALGTTQGSLSADGTKLLFTAIEPGGTVSGLTDHAMIYVKDLGTGTIEAIARDPSGGTAIVDSYQGVFSPDGKKVVFISNSALAAGDADDEFGLYRNDIYLKDLVTGTISGVSTDSNGRFGDGPSYAPEFTPDGRFVVYAHTGIGSSGDPIPSGVVQKNLSTGESVGLGFFGENLTFSPDGTMLAFTSRFTNPFSPMFDDVFVKAWRTDLADSLEGGDGRDTIRGGEGDDTIVGGRLLDSLSGGAGADVFRFLSLGDSRAGRGDVITDFSAAYGDVLDFAAIDPRPGESGDAALRFIGDADFTGRRGELRTAFDGTTTLVQLDRNGDLLADMEVRLLGEVVLGAGNLLL